MQSTQSASPLEYTWQFESNYIQDQYGPELIVDGVDGAKVGKYRVIVFNRLGHNISNWAFLSMRDPPNIKRHPREIEVDPGKTAVFECESSGTPPLTFTWEYALNGTGRRANGIGGGNL